MGSLAAIANKTIYATPESVEDSRVPSLRFGTKGPMIVTDCHIHIQPYEMFKAEPIEIIKKARPGDFEDILEYSRSPKALLKYMDSIGVERAVLINYVAPDVMGMTAEVSGK
jgi:hypothetical protein